MSHFSDGERKSVEPIATRACIDPNRADAAHQRLLHVIVTSEWSDHALRREAARYALDAVTVHEPVEAWIVDDTGFLKQGSHAARRGSGPGRASGARTDVADVGQPGTTQRP